MKEAYLILRQVLDDLGEKNVGLISAGVAFYGLFAIFPGLAAIIAIFGLVADADVVRGQLELVRGLVPPGVFALFEGQINGILNARSETLGAASVISLMVAIWSVRAGVAALVLGVNTVFERPSRHMTRHFMVSFLLSLSLILAAAIALLMLVIAPVAIAFMPIGEHQSMTLEITRWAIALLVMLFGLGLLYRYGPNWRGNRLAWVTPGSVVVVVSWLVMSGLFTIYVVNFSTYNEVYGSLGAVIALLMWFYLSAFLVMFGAALNMAIEQRRAL